MSFGFRNAISKHLRGNISKKTKGNLIRIIIATAGGLGLSPILPGTVASLAGVALYLLLWSLTFGIWLILSLSFTVAIIAVLNYILTPWAQEFWGHQDPSAFVLDEVAGFLIVPILAPGAQPLLVVTVGFVGFRVFDMLKIPPARQIDRHMHGAWDILLDDFVSGFYAAMLVNGLRYFHVAEGWFQAWGK